MGAMGDEMIPDTGGPRSDGSVFTVESLLRDLMHDPIHHLWDVLADLPTTFEQ